MAPMTQLSALCGLFHPIPRKHSEKYMDYFLNFTNGESEAHCSETGRSRISGW